MSGTLVLGLHGCAPQARGVRTIFVAALEINEWYFESSPLHGERRWVCLELVPTCLLLVTDTCAARLDPPATNTSHHENNLTTPMGGVATPFLQERMFCTRGHCLTNSHTTPVRNEVLQASQ